MSMLYATHDTSIGTQILNDIGLIAENANDLQTIVNQVFQSSSNMGIKINVWKQKCKLSAEMTSNWTSR